MKNKRLITSFSATILLTTVLSQNTLPTIGNVGVGTTNPSTKLEVIGKTSLVGYTTVKDSMKIEKKLTVNKDLKIIGKTVMTNNVKVKSNLTVLGNSKTKGNKIIEGDLKIKSLGQSSISEDRMLMISPNGKVKAHDKSTILDIVYGPPLQACFFSPGTTLPAPVWTHVEGSVDVDTTNVVGLGAITPGKLYTNQACPILVGIKTSEPITTLDVRGTTHFSSNSGVGIAPSNSVQLYVQPTTSNKNGICLDMPNSVDYNYGYKVRVDNDKVKGIAINRLDTGEDVFRVYVDGRIEGKSLRLSLSIWSDYVFDEDYKLLPLNELNDYIKENNHLPNVPTEQAVLEKGLDIGGINTILLEKIEELTLYIIQLNDEILELKNENKLIKYSLKNQ